jgi:DNA-binding transcriptional ArsR family regulator
MHDAEPKTETAGRGLDDVEAMRALAHPLRLRILGLLRIDGPATSTIIARRLGTDTGSTSYHLRQLARGGFVEDVDELGAGRERYWRASERSTDWESPALLATPERRTALQALQWAALQAQIDLLEEYLAEEESWGAAWAKAATHADYVVRTTPEGLSATVAEIEEVLRRHDAGESGDGEQVILLLHAFPRRQRR